MRTSLTALTTINSSFAARPFNGAENKTKKGKATNGDSDIDMADENRDNSGDDAACASTSDSPKNKSEYLTQA